MKKFKKIILLVFCIYLAICQISSKTYSYTEDEIKDIIQYRDESEEENEHDESDPYYVEIETKNLKSDAEIPVIQATIDYVLYADSFFSNINFFALNNNIDDDSLKYTNVDEANKMKDEWKNGSKLVKDFLRVTIYIATASLLTLLIYFAVIMVKRTISDSGAKLPGEDLVSGDGSVSKSLKDKIFIEQWIKSVAMMTLIIVIINLVISFSNYVSADILQRRGENGYNPITIHIKTDGSTGAEEIPDLPDDLENLQAKDLFEMGNIAYDHTDQPEGQQAMDYIFNTIGSLVNIAHSKFPMKKSLVIAQVVLESGWVCGSHDSNHIKEEHNNIIGINAYSALTSPETTWAKKGGKTADISMPHHEGSTHATEPVKHYDNLYECIEDYMGQFIYHHPQESFGDYNDITNYENYIHGYTPTEDAGRDMYIYYKNQIEKYNLERFDNMPDTPVGSRSSAKPCYFNTSLEGLYMLESQYKWEGNVLHNLMYIFCGFCLTVTKWILFILFKIRLEFVKYFIIISPLIIIIDAVKKVNGSQGILKKGIISYIYAVLLKPVLGLIYFVLTSFNTKTVAENPFYILLVIAVMFICFSFSFRKVQVYITGKKE